MSIKSAQTQSYSLKMNGKEKNLNNPYFLGSCFFKDQLFTDDPQYYAFLYQAPFIYFMLYLPNGNKENNDSLSWLMRCSIEDANEKIINKNKVFMEKAVPYDFIGSSYSPFVPLRAYAIGKDDSIVFVSSKNGYIYKYNPKTYHTSGLEVMYIPPTATSGLPNSLPFLKERHFANLYDTPHGILCLVQDVLQDVSRQYLGLITKKDSKISLEIIHSGYDYYMDLVYDSHLDSCAVMTSHIRDIPWRESQIHYIHLPTKTSIPLMNKDTAYAYPTFDSKNHDFIFLCDKTGYLAPYKIPYTSLQSLHDFHPIPLPFKDNTEVGFSIPFMDAKVFDVQEGKGFYRSSYKGKISLISSEKQQVMEHLPFVDFNHITCCDHDITFVGSFDHKPSALILMHSHDNAPTQWIKIHLPEKQNYQHNLLIPSSLDKFDFVSFSYGAKNNTRYTVYAYYYASTSTYKNDQNIEKKPLIVKIHGGPIQRTTPAYNKIIQFWRTLGFSYLDINYHGSLGFGKKYRDQLHHQWGVLDVLDVLNMVDFIRKKFQHDVIFLDGNSAGGMTALLCGMGTSFIDGISIFAGIYNPEALPFTPFDFERYFPDSLMAPWPRSEATYKKRSPLRNIAQLKVPLLVMHGRKDHVIPFQEFERFIHALSYHRKKYITSVFDNAGHWVSSAQDKALVLQMKFDFYRTFLQTT